MALSGKRLAIVVSTAPAAGDLARAADLALAARRRGVDVELFVMSEATAALAQPGLADELLDHGCDVVACATSADALGLDLGATRVTLGSQDDHAAMVHRADRVVAFT